MASVVVDTTPPTTVITSQPGPITATSNAALAFVTRPSEPNSTFACRWLHSPTAFPPPTTPATGNATFGACTGNATNVASKVMKNGYWVFQVKVCG